ncbi:MAG: Na+/H+ antiporter subunit E [Trueperaceae bacterium]|nr:MAG: Na+/H+ antiporter subunit E [Trueperaceae bacterium]
MGELLGVVSLALLWSFLAGGLSFFNLVVGLLIGMLLLSVVARGRYRSFLQRLLGFLRFFVRFLGELVVANVIIARLAFTPVPRFHPHVIAFPLRVRSEAAITLLSATITLLPGTVAMGVSSDRRTLYAHAIGEADVERSRESVRRIEELILGFMS